MINNEFDGAILSIKTISNPFSESSSNHQKWEQRHTITETDLMQQTRTEFIKKFNSMPKADKVDILLQTGISEDIAYEFSDSDASEIVQNMTDGSEIIHEVWNIMEGMETVQN